MDTLEALFDHSSALVFGIGGSGDIVGSIPTARLLEAHGLEVTLGGVAWEPVPKDTRVGPRPFSEIDAIDPISETVARVHSDTQTTDGVTFSETFVARHVDNEVVLLDITGGVDGLRDGIAAAADVLDIDLVVGVDAGGDVLARGTEPGVRSPLTDGLGLVALDELTVDASLGVFGYGSDGELTPAELEARVGTLAHREGLLGGWGLTPRVRDELEILLETVSTEASRIPVEAFRGAFGPRTIRNGRVTVEMSPASLGTFYFKPAIVAGDSEIATAVRGTDGLEAAADALRQRGLQTEFETERERLTADRDVPYDPTVE